MTSRAAIHAARNIAIGNEKPWSMPTSVGSSSESLSTNHSAISLRVQYLRGLGGGSISFGATVRSADVNAQALETR